MLQGIWFRRYEPYMPQLQPLLEVGGVMVIKGREGLGAKELEDYIRDFGGALPIRRWLVIDGFRCCRAQTGGLCTWSLTMISIQGGFGRKAGQHACVHF